MTDSPVGVAYEKNIKCTTPDSSPSLKKVEAFPTHSHLQAPKWGPQLFCSCRLSLSFKELSLLQYFALNFGWRDCLQKSRFGCCARARVYYSSDQ
uniref:Uncharacterized protein n=1 Tax=Podarcis muralis TaxID=64176 RepID=A0A670J832_PODMU